MRPLAFSVAAGLVLVPLSVLALDYTNTSSRYSDAPFSMPESAAINVLTNLGAVGGNPDGTFAPKRLLNRAEFTKIALLSKGIAAGAGVNCFPDVHTQDWFSSFVCEARTRNIVAGNPDGLFHPERSVNNVEAVKILASLYGYQTETQAGDKWYTPFLRAAALHHTALPIALQADSFLTRGQMARLTAAFRAEADGELAQYRAAESGRSLSSSSSSQAASSSSLASSSVSSAASASSVSSHSSSLSSSSSSASVTIDLPARSHFLVLGALSAPIASANFTASLEPADLRSAQVKLKSKIDSIDAMFLIDSTGKTIGQLTRDHLFDNTDKTWRGSFNGSGSGAYVLPKDIDRTLAIIVRMKNRDAGGSSEELVQVDTFKISAQGENSGNSYDSAPTTFSFPQHQTAQGRITAVSNALAAQDALPIGTNQLLGAFSFAAMHVNGSTIALTNLDFQIGKSSSVAVGNWQLGGPDSAVRVPCSVNGTTLSCSGIPAELGDLTGGQRTLRVFGDVSLDAGAGNYTLQLSLVNPGFVGSNGAISWSDKSGNFNWTELQSPIARGTLWK